MAETKTPKHGGNGEKQGPLPKTQPKSGGGRHEKGTRKGGKK